MTDRRVRSGVDRPETVTIRFEDRDVPAVVGESVAAALWAAGEVFLRRSSKTGEPRGLFCNMGICFECLVLVDGRVVRSCMTPVMGDGMVVRRGGRPPESQGS